MLEFYTNIGSMAYTRYRDLKDGSLFLEEYDTNILSEFFIAFSRDTMKIFVLPTILVLFIGVGELGGTIH